MSQKSEKIKRQETAVKERVALEARKNDAIKNMDRVIINQAKAETNLMSWWTARGILLDYYGVLPTFEQVKHYQDVKQHTYERCLAVSEEVKLYALEDFVVDKNPFMNLFVFDTPKTDEDLLEGRFIHDCIRFFAEWYDQVAQLVQTQLTGVDCKEKMF